MKKLTRVLIVWVLFMVVICVSQAEALTVYDDYIYDETAGLYWYRNLQAFTSLDYYEQNVEINLLDTDTVDWRMATLTDMQSLWEGREFEDLFIDSEGDEIFFHSYQGFHPSKNYNITSWLGRYDEDVGLYDGHYVAGEELPDTFGYGNLLSVHTTDDTASERNGAWAVTSDQVFLNKVVPEPSTWLLITVGFTCLIWIQRKHTK
jgi:hypothetical protein